MSLKLVLKYYLCCPFGLSQDEIHNIQLIKEKHSTNGLSFPINDVDHINTRSILISVFQ